MKKLIMGCFIFIILLVAIAGTAYFWYQGRLNSRQSTDEKFAFEVKPSESADVLIDRLIKEGLTSDKIVWQVYLKLNPALGNNIQAGNFMLNTNMSIPDVITALQKAEIKKGIKITIPEGLRYDEIATVLEKGFAGSVQNHFIKEEFIKIAENPGSVEFSEGVTTFLARNKPSGKNLEGYLFPETYFFEEGISARAVIEKLIIVLNQKLTESDYQAIYSSKYSYYEYLTVASLIERETLTEAEKPMVADVIFKRLENGISGVKLLQIDASLLYMIKDWKGAGKINEAFKEQYKANPYNTYRIAGLPPTPICNPGISSLKAAIYPEKNEYYFYIHDSNGVIHYGKNLSEHNANVRKYL